MTDSSRPVTARRHFLKLASGAVVAIPLAGRLAHAEEAAKVTEDDPTAVALGYKHDAASVDTAAYPKRAGEEGAKQFCSNCALYAGGEAEWGACPIFANKHVNRNGWCNSWVAAG
jgi:hypothetical protein